MHRITNKSFKYGGTITVSLMNQHVFSYESQSGWQHKVSSYELPHDTCNSIKRPKDEQIYWQVVVYRLSNFSGASPSFRYCNAPDAAGLDKGTNSMEKRPRRVQVRNGDP